MLKYQGNLEAEKDTGFLTSPSSDALLIELKHKKYSIILYKDWSALSNIFQLCHLLSWTSVTDCAE